MAPRLTEMSQRGVYWPPKPYKDIEFELHEKYEVVYIYNANLMARPARLDAFHLVLVLVFVQLSLSLFRSLICLAIL